MIKHNTQEAIDFLERFCPGGPWLLNAINPSTKGGSLVGKTFTWEQVEEMTEWIEGFQGKRNLYFTVNPRMMAIDNKAGRKQIKELAWLHVDIDPRAGENIDDEKTRGLKVLADPPYENVPPPTVIVFSGGGVQGFWKLEEPLIIDGEETLYEKAATYNKKLEELFGADNCHNVDRIMRLPGTLNIPNEIKRKKGRTLSLARLVSFDEDRVYPLTSFRPAMPTQEMGADLGFSGNTVEVSGNIAAITSIEELSTRADGALDEWLKDLIVNGYDPNDPRKELRKLPRKYPSRSEALFAVVCALVKLDVSTEAIYSTITDKRFKISRSVLEKRTGSSKYALRQIERAQEEIISPWLRKLNEKYAVVASIGGKCRVIFEEEDIINIEEGISRSKLVKQTFADFANVHMHQSHETGIKDKNGNAQFTPLGKWWLQHARRRQYDRIVFVPGREVKGAYNLWRGFAVDSVPGDPTPFLGHVFDNVCSGNQEHYEYLIGWMARCVQYPATQGHTAVVLRGRSGVGKGFFAKWFGSLWGRHYVPVCNAKHLTGDFNAHLRDAVVIFADEAVVAEDARSHISQLKYMVTEDHVLVTPKGIDSEMGANYTHIIMASNDDWIVPTNEGERRFFVLDVNASKMQDGTYFKGITESMTNGGREALLYYLQNLDITDYDVRKLPITEALIDQKMYSFGPYEDWWFAKLQEGRLLSEHADWVGEVEKDLLFQDFYDTTSQNSKSRTARISRIGLGKFLGKVCPGMNNFQKSIRTGDVLVGRPYFSHVPSLKKCRKDFDKACGGPFSWTKIDELPEQGNMYPEVPF